MAGKRVLLLDFDRTLHDSNAAYIRTFDGLFGKPGSDLIRRYLRLYKEVILTRYLAQQEDLSLHIRLFLEHLSLPVTNDNVRQVRERLDAAWALCRQAAVPFSESVPFLDRMSELGYTLWLATGDYGAPKAQSLERLGGRRYFAGALDQQALGVGKGHAAYFQRALERAGAAPEEALVVGDSIVNDIRPAMAAGLDAVWVNRDGDPLPEERLAFVSPDLTRATRFLEGLAPRGVVQGSRTGT